MLNLITKAALLLFVFCCSLNLNGQTISLTSENELAEFKEKNSTRHYSYILFPLTDDSLFAYQSQTVKKISAAKKIEFAILNPVTTTRYNSTAPFGWNDGVMIPNKGFQNSTTAGIYVKKNFFSMQLRPELLLVENRKFETFPQRYDDRLWAVMYNLYNQIDNPEHFTKIKKLYPGQSNIKFRYKQLSTGISSENRWWGPGLYNNLLLSNNAPGFVHYFLQTERPIETKIGHFEFQLIAGNIHGSEELPPDTGRTINNVKLYHPKPADDKRYVNGFVFVYQPSFAKGLSLGMGRVFYLYNSDRQKTFNGYLPVFGSFFKSKSANEDDRKRDQMISIYLKQTFEKGKSNVYFEFGRNDHASNMRDFITDPFHSRAYVTGINKFYQLPKRNLNINIEVTELSKSAKSNPRPTPYWYLHHQILHGYTNNGQIMGAGIGAGSAMQSVTADFSKTANNTFGIYLYRIERNKDFFYDAFLSSGEYNRKWVDMALGCKLHKSFRYFSLSSNITLIRSLNYQWKDESSLPGSSAKTDDLTNFSATIRLQYKL